MSPRRIVVGLLSAVAVAVGGSALPAFAAQASSTYIEVQAQPGLVPMRWLGFVLSVAPQFLVRAIWQAVPRVTA